MFHFYLEFKGSRHKCRHRLSLNPCLVPDLFLPTTFFNMHKGRLILIRDLVPVLNQQKLIMLWGRVKVGDFWSEIQYRSCKFICNKQSNLSCSTSSDISAGT